MLSPQCWAVAKRASRPTWSGESVSKSPPNSANQRWKGSTVRNNSPAQRALAFVLSLSAFLVLCQHFSLGQNVSPQNLGFGNVAVNLSAAKTLTITDDRQRDLIVESVTVMGTAFAISTPAMPMTLTPGGSTGFVVTFTPPTSGTFDGNVVVTLARHADGGNGSRVVRVPLIGTGAGSGTGSPVLQSITVSPTSASIAVGATQQFTATGHYSNGSTQTLAAGVTWNSSATTYATIGATGLATGVAAGSTSITASSSGVVSTLPAALAVSAAVTTGSGKSFYVAPTGSDSNPGTSAAPWLTIQHAASTVPAGSTVYVEAGTYNESINVTVSGTSSAPITFTGESGAIVTGTGLTPSTSQTQGLWNIGSATPAGVDVNYVTIQGFTIENYTTSNANACPAGIWVSGASNGIQILNNTITNITTTSEKNGNAFGIAAYGTEAAAINGLVISGNTVYGLKTGNSETVNVDGNVTNFTISNNIIHDNDNIGIDAIGGEGVGPSGSDYARYGEISGNTVYNISAIDNAGEGDQYDADGIYCDTCAYVVIERNLVHNCDLNIEVASEHSGKYSQYVTVRNNVVYNANSVGISIGGYASNVGGSQYVTIANNTLFEDDTQNTGSGELQVQYYATNNVFENNLVYATSQGLFINNYTNSEANPVTADYNLYYSSVSSSGAQFIWDGASENGFPSYQSKTGQDSHSQYANPLLQSTTALNLQVQASSPAIDAGSTLSSLICSTTTGETGDYWGCPLVGTLDFLGNPREPGSNIDIGAYEQ